MRKSTLDRIQERIIVRKNKRIAKGLPEKIRGKQIKVYDNGGKTADRFTVVYLDCPENKPDIFSCVGMSENPFHPQGFGQHSTAMDGEHLGKRIKFLDLPVNCQKLVLRDLGKEF